MDYGSIAQRSNRASLLSGALQSPPKVKLYYNNTPEGHAVLPPLDFFSIFVGLITGNDIQYGRSQCRDALRCILTSMVNTFRKAGCTGVHPYCLTAGLTGA